jgi:hypothetical protein
MITLEIHSLLFKKGKLIIHKAKQKRFNYLASLKKRQKMPPKIYEIVYLEIPKNQATRKRKFEFRDSSFEIRFSRLKTRVLVLSV